MAIPTIEQESFATNSETAGDLTGENSAHLVRRVQQAFRDGAQAHGCALAHAAIEQGVRHPSLYYFRAFCRARGENYQEALADFESARALAPSDPILLEATGHCLTMMGRFPAAIEAFDGAIAIRSDFTRAHYRKGIALELLNEIDAARAAHERVLAIEPDHADALASLAFIAARRGETGETRHLSERAIAMAPRHGIARVALAMAYVCEEQFSDALELLSAVLADSAGIRDGRLNMALGFAADEFDRRGQHPEAFQLYAEVNARRRQIHEARFAAARAIDDVARLTEAVKHCNLRIPDKQPVENAAGANGHVFLLGFVRSGTTLLETILASNPSVTASDERDFLANAADELLHQNADLHRLATLDHEALAYWRSDYWNRVQEAGPVVAGRIFVDKVPLNSLRLPLIARLFPDAKILLAIRDPRDVVLSAFRHRFNMYSASFEFLRLDDCARFYASVMQLVEAVRESAPFLDVCEIRYEDLVADFDRTVSAVCAFTGMDWNDGMRHFQTASSTIDRRSQSAAQVRRGLYGGAAEQWRRYAAQLAPVMPILAPWIARFGYKPDQSTDE